ncbi:MAG: hypothetical protein HKN16_03150 [Saprospiraceae bacterium]|nr:hypothetical protein [Saprospiraceae bacterium]
MFEDFNQDAERNRSVIALLCEMARADKEQSRIEEKYIEHVAEQLGVVPEEVNLIKTKPEQFPFKPPSAEKERMTILYYLLFTMRVDRKIRQKEEDMAHSIGIRLGINPALTQDLIRVMKYNDGKEIPENAMLDQIKKYLN